MVSAPSLSPPAGPPAALSVGPLSQLHSAPCNRRHDGPDGTGAAGEAAKAAPVLSTLVLFGEPPAQPAADARSADRRRTISQSGCLSRGARVSDETAQRIVERANALAGER